MVWSIITTCQLSGHVAKQWVAYCLQRLKGHKWSPDSTLKPGKQHHSQAKGTLGGWQSEQLHETKHERHSKQIGADSLTPPLNSQHSLQQYTRVEQILTFKLSILWKKVGRHHFEREVFLSVGTLVWVKFLKTDTNVQRQPLFTLLVIWRILAEWSNIGPVLSEMLQPCMCLDFIDLYTEWKNENPCTWLNLCEWITIVEWDFCRICARFYYVPI